MPSVTRKNLENYDTKVIYLQYRERIFIFISKVMVFKKVKMVAKQKNKCIKIIIVNIFELVHF